MADPTFATEKPAFDFEQKNAPVTPPEDLTSLQNMDSAGADLSKPSDTLPPQTNGDPTADPHYLGLHPGLSNGATSDPTPTSLAGVSGEMDNSDIEQPVEHVAQGLQPAAAFVPEQRENPTEIEPPIPTTTSTVPPAIDQPVSDVRDEPSDQPTVLDSGITLASTEVNQPNPVLEAAQQDTTQPVAAAVGQPQSDTAMSGSDLAAEPIAVAAPLDEKVVEEAAAEPVIAEPAVVEPARVEPPVADSIIADSTVVESIKAENVDITPAEDTTLADPTADHDPASMVPAPGDAEMTDAPAPTSNGVVRPREEDESDEPAAKRTKTEEQPETDPAVEFKKPDLPALSTETATTTTVEAVDTPASATTPVPASDESIDAGPISPEQKKYLVELLRRAKKTKDAQWFLAPVDHVALNLPTYPDIVKEPMDLGTIETNLKSGSYASVDAMTRDIHLMADNANAFNGPQHTVTVAGGNTRNYLMKSIKSQLPRKGSAAAAAPKTIKKEAAPPRPSLPRRESRAVARSPTSNARSPGAETYALQPDGTPLIRRDSAANDGRPKREIHRPQPKDLPYQTTRPKSKKHQTELKFCNHVMKELMKKEHGEYAWPFYDPVDPVALNIPSYHKVIKKPMDLGTVQSNLKNGQYTNGKEFKADVELIFTNCFKFNPSTDNVHQLGKKLDSVFKDLWSQKDDWIREHSTPDTRSDEEDEEDEDDEEEEEEEGSNNIDASRLAAIQAQINALSAEMTSLVSGASAVGSRKSPTAKPAKKGKKGGDAPAPKKTKRSSSVANASAAASKPEKKKKPAKIPKLSQEQKREVSEGIGMLDDAGMRKAVQIIRNGVPSLQNVNDDELELDIDEIPDAVVYDLYKFVRSLRPKPSAADHVPDDGEYAQEADDDDFVPPARARGSTAGGAGPGRKKNKPMTAVAQEAKIQELKDKLQAFQSQGPEAGAMVDAAMAHTASATPDEDDDEDAEGSSSEEE